MLALAIYHGGISLFHTLPAVIAIHGIVTAHYSGDLANADFLKLFLKLLHIGLAAAGGDVTAVQKAVNVDLCKLHTLCHFQQGVKMAVMAVYTAIGQQPHEMQCLAVFPG